jgi:hypothetical protein
VLKVGWRHREAEHEADGLRHWDGDGAVRCFATRSLEDTTALLLERCTPGRQLKGALPEPRQDEIIAGLLRRLWSRAPQDGHMLNCEERMAADPGGLARRMADLLDLDPERVRLWLFARCAQESLHDTTMREPARRLAP